MERRLLKMIEKILNFSIAYRYLILAAIACAMLLGISALKNLPMDAVPDITNNQVQINTLAIGLTPMEVEKRVTFPIESALSGIPGLESTRSLSRNGFSQITAIFHDQVNIYFARQQINEKLMDVRNILPAEAEFKMGPISTGLSEVFMWSVDYSPEMRQSKQQEAGLGWHADGSYLTPEGQLLKTDVELASYLRTVQDWIITPQIKAVKGIAGVDAQGGFIRQYHVEPSPEKMMAFDISLQDLLTAIEENNLNGGAGYIERGGESLIVKVDGRIENQENIGNIVVAMREDMPVFIHDVAEISIGKELRSGSASKDGKEVVIGTALMLIGENSRSVAEAVREKLQWINTTLPLGVIAQPVLSRSKLIDTTIQTVARNLIEGALLVIVILFIFLGNFRAALITALVIPISMLITAIGMVQAKISGNLMSLGALDFGLIIDGAVIIVENCLRRLGEKQKAQGKSLQLEERLEEVMQASKEMIQPSVYGQAIIIAVYLPILTLSGVEGKMFHPMALTVLFALLSAFVLSLTFVPAMVAIWITKPLHERENFFISTAKKVYECLLWRILSFPYLVATIAIFMVAAALILFSFLGQEFIPTLDEQDLAIQVSRIPSTSLTQATSMQLQIEKVINKFDEVAYVYSKTGTAEMASDPMPPYASDTFVILKPRPEWPDAKRNKEDLVKAIETRLKKLPGNIYEFTQPVEMRFNELIAGVRSDLAVKVYGDDYKVLKKTAEAIAQVMQKLPGAADVTVDKTDGLPTLEININRNILSRYHLNMKEVLEMVGVAIGGGKAGTLFEGDRHYDIIVRLPEKLRNDLLALSRLPIRLPLATSKANKKIVFPYIPLSEVANLDITTGLNQIRRENGKRVVIIQANIRGADMSTFVEVARKKISEEVKIPAGYWIEWGGQFENLIAAKKRLLIVVPAAFFLIFILLYVAFHSIRQAFLVFSAIPLAFTGGIIALWWRGILFSISAAIGFIALSGIAILNSLVLINCINQWILEEASAKEAILKGSIARFRPVVVTALVAALGFLPMALAQGAGAEVQKPLATVVIGGLISSTLLTLVVLPALYILTISSRNLKTFK